MTTSCRLLTVILLLATSGCASLCDDCDDFCCSCRDRYRSHMAWYRCKSAYCGTECESDFGAGFRDGYAAMSGRGCSTAPSVPPRSYWGAAYQSEYGHQQMQAWYDGYAHGAMNAEQDGMNQWSRIRTTEVAPQRGAPRPEHKVVPEEKTLPQTAVPPATPATPGKSASPPVQLEPEEVPDPKNPDLKNQPEASLPGLQGPSVE